MEPGGFGAKAPLLFHKYNVETNTFYHTCGEISRGRKENAVFLSQPSTGNSTPPSPYVHMNNSLADEPKGVERQK